MSKIATKNLSSVLPVVSGGTAGSQRMQNETTNESALNRKRGPHSDMP